MRTRFTQRAFTLVELIVVITILAVLGTVSFMSIQGYSESARNSVRIDGVSKIATVVENEKISGRNLMAYTAGGQEVPNAQIGGTGAIVGTEYKAGDPNAQALNIQEEQFKDPQNSTAYKLGVTNKKGGQYEVATTLKEGSSELAKVMGSYTPRTQAFLSGNANTGTTLFTLSQSADLNKLFYGDTVTGIGIPTGTTISNISSDGMKLTLSTPTTATVTSIQLGSDEVAGLILGTTGTNPVVNNTPIVPYTLLVGVGSSTSSSSSSSSSGGGYTVYNCLSDLTQTEVDELNTLTPFYSGTISQWCARTIYAISYQTITEIPSGVYKLTSLNRLFLTNNNINTILPEIANLSSLSNFDLTGNSISSLPATISNLSNLTTLTLSKNQFTTFPTEILSLSQIVSLSLQDNNISSLPATIGNLSNLEELWLGFNQLTSLPTEIGNLTNLSRLDIAYNNISSLPSSIGNLTALTEINFNDNQLTSLPTSIGNLTNIGNVNLQNNQLSSLPDEIGNWNNLGNFLLDGNQLSSLPNTIGSIGSIFTLGLYGNNLTTFPASIGNLSIDTISAGNNSLSTLPVEMQNLHPSVIEFTGNTGLGNLNNFFDANSVGAMQPDVCGIGCNMSIQGNGSTIDIYESGGF